MEYKGYKIESIKNDGHLQRVAFGIYKNGKLISTATTSKEAQHEIDDIERELKDMKTIDKLANAIKMLDEDKAYSVSYRIGNGPYQSIGVIAGSESEAIKKFRAYKEKRGQKDIEVIGASIGESLATMERKGKPIIR